MHLWYNTGTARAKAQQRKEIKTMTAREVLSKVNSMINEGEAYKEKWQAAKKWKIDIVYKELGIFDWWNKYLSVAQLKQMKKFLETAIAHGFEGYVCFKVGAKGCSNGMWAHKAESTTGYSPDGEALFHSFVSGENYFDYRNEKGEWLGTHDKFRFTLAEVEAAIVENRA